MEKRKEDSTLKELASMIDAESERRAGTKYRQATLRLAQYLNRESLTSDAILQMLPEAETRLRKMEDSEAPEPWRGKPPREYIDNERRVLIKEMLTLAQSNGGQRA